MKPASGNRIYLFDTTLRDGAQTQGVDFTVADKLTIAKELDNLGIDYIEAGWPGANPTDDAFFAAPPKFRHSKLTAFGMTKRAGRSAANDDTLNAVLNVKADVYCLVGKTWDFHVDVALNITLDENIANISESIRAAAAKGEAIFDAEHFFDAYKANPEYALLCAKTAFDAGARWVVLCDTNGGTLPHEIEEITKAAAAVIPPVNLGIHTHDDTGNAVANSLAAVRAGARMIQGTLNGLGERCGNANLISLIPTLMVKMGYDVGLKTEDLKKLRPLSRLLDEMLGRTPDTKAPYVGERAFVHKGGLHASAVRKNAASYEHIAPELVGNRRIIAVSDQAGRANIAERLKDIGIAAEDIRDDLIGKLVEIVKRHEYEGYAYDGAEASFEVLARRTLGQVPEYFALERFSVTDDCREDEFLNLRTLSEATVRVNVNGKTEHMVAEGNGPVNALDLALRKALEPVFPALKDLMLVDYRVRILKAQDATAAVTRVWIESGSRANPEKKWFTVGVSGNIIDASYHALCDSYIYTLLHADESQRKPILKIFHGKN